MYPYIKLPSTIVMHLMSYLGLLVESTLEFTDSIVD